MKNMLVHFTAYNYWANQQLVKGLLKLTEEQLDKPFGAGVATIRSAVYQLWQEESTWYQRLQLTEKISDPTMDFGGTFSAACDALLKQSRLLEEWVQQANQAKLNHTIAYTLKKSEHYKMGVQDVIIQVCNHSTFYRGQVVYMLGLSGIGRLPVTDYSRFKPKK
ncbi:MAG: hypothetical protein J7623_17850 [Chitinophaga sp.]|uniref:DinB family protein n=1 Tax=Chitinophaga sp. TaxID=1869181 RepID=UPI001B2BA1ED|nr:DinB family protein [Chitinophaga sp.]MBO9730510.1 hypothetical protein [Chitinophaga sp.]